eukprot:scaffold291756_cov83-Cyclotella_meneghiniana.AAC.1
MKKIVIYLKITNCYSILHCHCSRVGIRQLSCQSVRSITTAGLQVSRYERHSERHLLEFTEIAVKYNTLS